MPEFWSFEIHADSPDQQGLLVARPDLPASLFILNHSARFLWSALQHVPPGAPPSLLAESFATHFGISLSHASADISSTVHAWAQTLLQPERPAESPVSKPNCTLPLSSSALFTCDFSLGTTSFRLVAHDPVFVDEIRPRLAHLVKPSTPAIPTAHLSSASPDHSFHIFRSPNDLALRVFCDSTFLASELDVTVARTIVLQEIARLAHHADSQWLAILHAAALADRATNKCVILPAATNSGKSTLAAALLHSGNLRFLSDDSAAILTCGHILPLPFAVMLREGSWPVLAPYFPELVTTPIHQRFSDPVRFLLPSITNTTPAIPKYLAVIDYQPAAAPSAAKLQRLTNLQTFYHLQKSGFWIPRHTRPAIAAFVSWVQSLPTYQLTYSSLSDAVSLIHNLLLLPGS